MHSVSWPPRAAVRLSVALVVALGLVALGAGLLAGRAASLGILLGALAGLAAAVTDVGWSTRLVVAALSAGAVWLGTAAADSPALSGLAVATAALAQVPLARRGARLGTMLPVMAAFGASLTVAGRATALAGWVLLGALAIGLIAAALGVSVAAQSTARGEAVRHAVATAVVAGAGLATARALDVGHGYWLVLAVASVLAVSRDATGGEAAERVAGTLAGVVAGVVAVAVLPVPAVLVAAGLCLVLTVAWTVSQQVRLASATGSALVVLVGSGGLVGHSAGLALERVLLTAAGAGLASGTVALLWRLDRRHPDPTTPTSPRSTA